ncbi:IclR family transcriptional regulator [Alkaliphilus serpentinus]|uniref:IclR family transcriptional regulator n=1 Tax=Alkaliphilus serpentinus TaxID=1482731 RepID=A0A833M6W6_9FIRM|nr:IclR family transcriptional regulator [Alkaliphilus serpentinus]KAB3529169.1 IclR family transcriptional regulator [Alkaliphilus serpentinus]
MEDIVVEEINKDKKTIGSVIKAIEIIELLAASETEIGATEISNHLNYGVSATYHLLATLKMCRMIEQDPKTKKYRLGIKLWKIGKQAMEQNNLVTFMKPFLKKLRDLTDETANLTVLDNNEIIYLAQEESKKLIRMFTKTGARAPLHCSAAGKVLLAYLPEDKRNFIIERLTFEKFTDKTIVTKDGLVKELEAIIEKGYGFDDEERELGVSCIAAPIFDFNNEIVAAISISGPTVRFDEEANKRFVEYLLNITQEISNELAK